MVVCIRGAHKIHACSVLQRLFLARLRLYFTATAQAGVAAAAASPWSPLFAPPGSSRHKHSSPGGADHRTASSVAVHLATALPFSDQASLVLLLLIQIWFGKLNLQLRNLSFAPQKLFWFYLQPFNLSFLPLSGAFYLARQARPDLPQARPAGVPPELGSEALWLSQTLFGFSFPH